MKANPRTMLRNLAQPLERTQMIAFSVRGDAWTLRTERLGDDRLHLTITALDGDILDDRFTDTPDEWLRLEQQLGFLRDRPESPNSDMEVLWSNGTLTKMEYSLLPESSKLLANRLAGMFAPETSLSPFREEFAVWALRIFTGTLLVVVLMGALLGDPEFTFDTMWLMSGACVSLLVVFPLVLVRMGVVRWSTEFL